MDFIATSKYLRVSPRKARVVAAAVKKLSLSAALDHLPLLAVFPAKLILKTLKSAVANSKLEAPNLTIKNILVDEGTRLKRQDKSHRYGRDRGIIHKPTSHITVILTDEVKSQKSKVKNAS